MIEKTRVWTRQPPAGTRARKGGIASGLICAATNGYEAVTGQAYTQPGKVGRRGRYNANDQSFVIAHGELSTSNLTVLLVGYIGFGAWWSKTAGIGTDLTPADGGVVFKHYGADPYVEMDLRNASGLTDTNSWGSSGYTNASAHAWVTYNGTDGRLFVNTDGSGGITINRPGPLVFQNPRATRINAASAGRELYALFIWNRILTTAERAAIAANPWQLFEPAKEALPYEEITGPADPEGITYLPRKRAYNEPVYGLANLGKYTPQVGFTASGANFGNYRVHYDRTLYPDQYVQDVKERLVTESSDATYKQVLTKWGPARSARLATTNYGIKLSKSVYASSVATDPWSAGGSEEFSVYVRFVYRRHVGGLRRLIIGSGGALFAPYLSYMLLTDDDSNVLVIGSGDDNGVYTEYNTIALIEGAKYSIVLTRKMNGLLRMYANGRLMFTTSASGYPSAHEISTTSATTLFHYIDGTANQASASAIIEGAFWKKELPVGLALDISDDSVSVWESGRRAIPLVGTAAAVELNSELSGTTTLSGSLTVDKLLQTSLTGTATISASLSGQAAALQASITGTATIAATLTGVQQQLAASLSGSAQLTGTLTGTAAQLTAGILGTATINATLSGTATLLSSSLAASSTLTASLTTGQGFNSSLSGTAALTAGLTTQIKLSTNLAAQSTLSASLTGTEIVGYIMVYNGASWQAKPVKWWNGVTYVTKPLKYWNGTQWTLA